MNRLRTLALLAMAVGLGGLMVRRQPPWAPPRPVPAPRQAVRPVIPLPAAAASGPRRTPAPPPSHSPEPDSGTRAARPLRVTQPSAAPATANRKPTGPSQSALTDNGYVVQDPAARAALASVGEDPAAAEYWAEAINDASLPPEERKDLIEDLNEDGLSDPQHPGPADLPLIASRLELITELAPYSMDQVNADAFAEAYQDLVGLLSGRPPR